jgi:outer membrane murein-binding lipoprotein Lpp
MTPRRASLTLLAAAVTWCGIALPGCSATLVPPDGLTDARVQAVELQRRVKELEGSTAELQAQLAAAQEQLAQANTVGATDREVAEATPRMVALAFAGGSAEWAPVPAAAVTSPAAAVTSPAAAVTSGGCEPSRHALVRVAVEPRDGLGRVLQVAGRCEVTVAIVDPAGKVFELGHRAIAPGELRAAWRAAFMGTHYSLEIPVLVPASAPPKVAWTVAVSCTDGWTRQTFRTSGAVAAPRE